MKVIKVSDEVHARLVEGAEGSIGSYIEELLDKPTTDVYPEYVKDLFKRVDKLVIVLEETPAGSEKKSLNPAGSGGGLKKIRNPQTIDAEIAQLDKDELEEVEFVQDDDAVLEIHSKFEAQRQVLRDEKTEFYNNLKRG